MASDLSTTGSIAIFLHDLYPGMSAGVSGNLVIISDLARQHVENFTQINIGSNSIADAFQPAIVNLARADLIDFLNQGGDKIQLAELMINETLTSNQYRQLAEMNLNAIGKGYQFAKSLS